MEDADGWRSPQPEEDEGVGDVEHTDHERSVEHGAGLAQSGEHPFRHAIRRNTMGTATTSPAVFQNPATGLPHRMESTAPRGSASRQESQVTGRRYGMPLTESALRCTACQRTTCP